LGGLQTNPGEQPHRESGPVSCGVTAAVFEGAGQVAASVIVTVWPGPVMVCVSALIVTVVVNVVVAPGKVDTVVTPASVIVVTTPGRVVVTTEVNVVAGIVTVVPAPVMVRPGWVTVWPG
jgi:hypothetical protein